MKIFSFGVALSFVVFTIGSAEPAKKAPVEETRAKYSKQSAEVLKIAEPVVVSKVDYWKDGGTIGIVLKDAKGQEHAFCLDGRFLPSKEHPDEKGTRNLFVGATHPTKTGAKMVELRGPEETALYGVMLRWANKHPNREALFNEKVDLLAPGFGNLWQIREFFLRLDARYTR